MPRFIVTVQMTVLADNADAALGIGMGAAQHLSETFNDDESLGYSFDVTARDADKPNTTDVVEDGFSACPQPCSARHRAGR